MRTVKLITLLPCERLLKHQFNRSVFHLQAGDAIARVWLQKRKKQHRLYGLTYP